MGKPTSSTTIVWLRQDLRLEDHPAFHRAASDGDAVIPLYIWGPEEEGRWAPGGASRWWLHGSLVALDGELREMGSRLTIRRGPALECLLEVIRESGARRVLWSRRYEPAVIRRDSQVKEALRASGIEAGSFNASLLHEPWTVKTQQDGPFQVFTPFWRACMRKPDPEQALPRPVQLVAPRVWPKSLEVASLGLEPVINWAGGLRAAWRPGAAGAGAALRGFLENAAGRYSEGRDLPSVVGTSRLSPHLHFGEVGPRQVWHAFANHVSRTPALGLGWRENQFLTEIGWREFAHHLLHHFPHTPEKPLRESFSKFPWRRDEAWLKVWQRGRTGYPLVDAGMRELWATGWMHNRVRMIAGSFLVKDLLISWEAGARWFWDTLVDADLAANTLGWQWTAGCGADAAPFFRIFNPVTQGKKFDPEGVYVRRWVPELGRLPDKWIHCPWETPPAVLRQFGIELGRDYPEPVVSHALARDVALDAFRRIQS